MKKLSAIRKSLGILPLFIMINILLVCFPNTIMASEDLTLSAKLAIKDAQVLISEKDYDRAIEILSLYRNKQIKTGDSEKKIHPLISFVLGNCYLLQEDYPEAAKYFKEAVMNNPGMVEAWLNLSKTFYELKRYEEAADCYNHAYDRSDPVNPDYLFFCGVGYSMAGQYTHALGVFEKLFNNHPDSINTQWRENYVHALLAADKPGKALPLIKKIIKDSEDEPRAKWQETLLYLYLQMEMYREALSHVNRLTREDCTNASWWKGTAHIHLILKDYKSAFAAMTIYGYLTPLTPEEKKTLGDLGLQLNIPVCSVPVYEELLKERPDKGIIKNLMAAYQSLGRPEEALSRLNEFYPGSNDPELCMLEADILFGMKRFQEAGKAYCRAAMQADSKTAGRVWMLAGYAAWKADDFSASLDAFEKAKKFRGQREAALLALAQLKKIKSIGKN